MGKKQKIASRDSKKVGGVCIPPWVTPALVSETLTIWNRWYKGKLTRQCALEIILNVGRLVEVAY